jgi:hypothetical protein
MVCFQLVSLINVHQGTTLRVQSNIFYCHSVDSLFDRDRQNVDVEMS